MPCGGQVLQQNWPRAWGFLCWAFPEVPPEEGARRVAGHSRALRGALAWTCGRCTVAGNAALRCAACDAERPPDEATGLHFLLLQVCLPIGYRWRQNEHLIWSGFYVCLDPLRPQGGIVVGYFPQSGPKRTRVDLQAKW
jgi:hypothetical protein